MSSSIIYEQLNKPFRKVDSQSLLQQQGAQSGWIRRQNAIKSWTKKFLVLFKGYVYTFKNETSSKPKSYFSLYGYKSVSTDVKDNEKAELWIFKILCSNKEETKYFAAASPSELAIWLSRFASEIQWANASKHDYMNCSALSYTSKPKRVQSDIQLNQTYDDVGSLSEQGEVSPLSSAHSCHSLPQLFEHVGGSTYSSIQNRDHGRQLPLPPIPPRRSTANENTATDIGSHQDDNSYMHPELQPLTDKVMIENCQYDKTKRTRSVLTLPPAPPPPLPPTPPPLPLIPSNNQEQNKQVLADSGQAVHRMFPTHADESSEEDEELYNFPEGESSYEHVLGDSIENPDFKYNRIDYSEVEKGLHKRKYCVISTKAYIANDDTELSFKEEEKFYVIGQESRRWLIGNKNGKKGLFPAEFVKKVEFSKEDTEHHTYQHEERNTLYDQVNIDDVTKASKSSNIEGQKGRKEKKESLYDKIGNISRKCITSEVLVPQQLRQMNRKSVDIYKKCLKIGVERRNKVRIIVVGPRKTGKTCLIRRLLRKGIKDVESTSGVEVHILKCKAKLGDKKWICNEELTVQDDVNSRLLQTIIETAQNHPNTNKDKAADEDRKNEMYQNTISRDDSEKRRSTEKEINYTTYETPETEKTQNDMTDDIEYNFDEDLRDLGEILKAPLDQENTVQIDLWDFAGDKEFYNTHKAFLSKDAIYLVTFNIAENADDTTMEDSRYDLKYWLETIRCYGTNEGTNLEKEHYDPPVFIVGTHRDMFKGNEDACREKLVREVGKAVENENTRKHVRNYYLVSSTDDNDENFEELRSEILRIAQSTSNWDKKVPLKWIHLERSLLEEISSGQFILSINQIRELAATTNHPITDHKEIELFLMYHHSIGTYIFFEDLPEYVVLYPQWLADAFKSIVSADKFLIDVSIVTEWENFRKTGRLGEKLLENLFNKQSPEITENKDHILKVMEKFDIIVRPKIMLKSQKVVQESHYYVPCMMRTKNLQEIASLFNCKSKSSWLCLEFEFLPLPLVTCVLVTCSRELSVATFRNSLNGDELIFYRDFALFHLEDYEDELLLISSFKNVIEIQVWKLGEQKRAYHTLRQEVDSLLQRLSRLFQMNISYKTKLKCSSAKFGNFVGMVDIEDIEQKSQYFCKHHNDIHSTSQMYFDWIGEEVQRSLTKEEINATRLSIITLSVLTDVLYDRLKLDSKSFRQRMDCDVSYLYAEIRAIGLHLPTKGTYGGKFKDIKDNHKKIGDDIERVRLIRNDIQHLSSFSMSQDRFMEIRRMCQTVAKRMECHNKKGTSYTEGIKAVLQKDISSRQAEDMEIQIMIDNPRLCIKEESYRATRGEGCTLECKVLVPLPDGSTIQWYKGKDDLRTNMKEDPFWRTKYDGASLQYPSLIILNCEESDQGFYSCEIKYPHDSAEYDDNLKTKWPITFLHVLKKTE